MLKKIPFDCSYVAGIVYLCPQVGIRGVAGHQWECLRFLTGPDSNGEPAVKMPAGLQWEACGPGARTIPGVVYPGNPVFLLLYYSNTLPPRRVDLPDSINLT